MVSDIEDIINNGSKLSSNAILDTITQKLYRFLKNNENSKRLKQLFLKEFQKMGKKYRIQMRKKDIVSSYKNLIRNHIIPDDPLFWKHIQKKPVRNTSGVNPITLMYSPYPNGQSFTCRYKCKYCQTHPEFPKSYGPDAPASARGIAHDFDAIKQMMSNLQRLDKNGHELDKLEMNYEGGTFSEIPRDYIEEFHRDTYYVANTYFDSHKREPFSIAKEMAINETARIRIIGMTIETRPDTIDRSELEFFRMLGVTRVQIGVQHTNNYILKKSDRGHTYEDAVKATHLLKTNGFKVVHHYMTALPYATPDDDMKMLSKVYSSAKGRPHELKIYPYSVVNYSSFKSEYEAGKFVLYSDNDPDEFKKVMTYALEKCPKDIRICRAVRDIPTTYILGGCRTPNLRQIVMDDLEKKGRECSDIRSREISRRDNYKLEDAVYFITKLNKNDYFLSYESSDRRALFGFLRLRLNCKADKKDIVFDELIDCAIIEELHVYSTQGMLVKVGDRKKGASQHCGIGKKLIRNAESIAWHYGCKNIAVISGEGVREYYKNRGFIYFNGSGRFMIKSIVCNVGWNIDYFVLFMMSFIMANLICLVYLQISYYVFTPSII